MIYLSRHKQLPAALQAASSALAISKSELDGLASRLRYIDELSWKLKSRDTHEDFRSFIDSAELHAALCLEIGNEGEYSWWLAHTAWTEGGANIAADFRGKSVALSFLSREIPMCVDVEHVWRWAADAAMVIDKLLDGFFDSNDIRETLGCLIALNAVIATILSGVSRQRLVHG